MKIHLIRGTKYEGQRAGSREAREPGCWERSLEDEHPEGARENDSIDPSPPRRSGSARETSEHRTRRKGTWPGITRKVSER